MSQNLGVVAVMWMLACWPVPTHAQPTPLPPLKTAPPPPEMSFEQRWQPEMQAPAIDLVARQNPVKTFRVTQQVEGMIPGAAPILPTHAFIKTEMAAVEPVPVKVDAPAPPARPKVRTIRKTSLDICARHGMRRVDYGRTWRCRK